MDLSFFIKGLVIGFLIAAPVGPIGVLCIRRSFSKGAISGLLTGLGAATADACYGAVAAFGLTFISSFLSSQKTVIQIIGIIFLLYLGVKTFFERPAKESTNSKSRTELFFDYISTFGLTLTNPMTVASFIAVFAGVGFATATNYFSAVAVVGGVFFGSVMWWLILSSAVGLLRKKSILICLDG